MHQPIEFTDMEREYFLHTPEEPSREIVEPPKPSELEETALEVKGQILSDHTESESVVFTRPEPVQSLNRRRQFVGKDTRRNIARVLTAGVIAGTSAGIFHEKHVYADGKQNYPTNVINKPEVTPNGIAAPTRTPDMRQSTPMGTLAPSQFAIPSPSPTPLDRGSDNKQRQNAIEDIALLGGLSVGGAVAYGTLRNPERRRRIGNALRENANRVRGKAVDVWSRFGTTQGKESLDNLEKSRAEYGMTTGGSLKVPDIFDEVNDVASSVARDHEGSYIRGADTPISIGTYDSRGEVAESERNTDALRQGREMILTEMRHDAQLRYVRSADELTKYLAHYDTKGEEFGDILKENLSASYEYFALTHPHIKTVSEGNLSPDKEMIGGYIARDILQMEKNLKAAPTGIERELIRNKLQFAQDRMGNVQGRKVHEAELYLTQRLTELKRRYDLTVIDEEKAALIEDADQILTVLEATDSETAGRLRNSFQEPGLPDPHENA